MIKCKKCEVPANWRIVDHMGATPTVHACNDHVARYLFNSCSVYAVPTSGRITTEEPAPKVVSGEVFGLE